MDSARTINKGDVYRLWTPLALTWVMMSAEAPVLTAIIARLPEAKLNLAAYGLAGSIILLCEAPILGMMSAAIALVRDKPSYDRLLKFGHSHSFLLSLLVLTLSFSRVFEFCIEPLLGIHDELSELTREALFISSPIPFFVSYRRFFQGVLVRSGKGRAVAWGTLGRMLTMTAFGLLLYSYGVFDGVQVGSTALTLGIVIEALLARWMAEDSIETISVQDPKSSASYGEISRFFYPFALSILVAFLIFPVISLFLAKSRFPLESLALFPVLTGLTLLFRCWGFAYQEVVVAILSRDPSSEELVRNVAREIAGLATLGLALIVLTPIGGLWLGTLSGLSEDLIALSKVPAALLVCTPALATWICTERGYFIFQRRTGVITLSGVIELSAIVLGMYLGVYFVGGVGIVVSSCSLLFSASLSGFWLRQSRKTAPALAASES